LLLGAFILFSCNNKKQSTQITAETKEAIVNFDWLNGSWIRTNNEEGKTTYESWSKKDASNYQGTGFTLQNTDTISMEDMALVKSLDNWHLEVIAPGESEKTLFKLIKIEEGNFIAENQANEFPKIIEYKLSGDTLKALISNPDMEIPFDFIRDKVAHK